MQGKLKQHSIAIFLFFGAVWSSPVILRHQDVQNINSESPELASLDVKTTIEEVQSMLDSDLKLPRLTRGEIEDLFEQVTKEEYEKSLKTGDIRRAKHMRALMLVLPYNTKNNSANEVQEIYNRPPVTKVVLSAELKDQSKPKVILPDGKIEIIAVNNIEPTTFKPYFRKKQIEQQRATTRRSFPEVMKTATTAGPTLYVTTIYSSVSRNQNKNITELGNRFSSTYNAKLIDFNREIPAPKTTSKRKITPELEQILKSLGYAAQSQSRKRFKLEEPKDADLSNPVISSIIKKNRIYINDFESETEALTTDDFKKSLIPEIKPEDYLAFKPLSVTKNSSRSILPELQNYLKLYGIIENKNNRSEKSIKVSNSMMDATEISAMNAQVFPSSSKRPARTKRIDTWFEENLSDFGKIYQHGTDELDFIQLHRLLTNIRQLQELNISLTMESLKKLDMNSYNLSKTFHLQGPDPLEHAEFADPFKNEIKRQSDNAEPTKISLGINFNMNHNTLPKDVDRTSPAEDYSTSTESPKSTSSTSIQPTQSSTTIQPRSDDELDPITEEPLPTPRKNGFYFLADWNSFLEVGEGDEQVVVRFNPKIGDPSRFIPVTVP